MNKGFRAISGRCGLLAVFAALIVLATGPAAQTPVESVGEGGHITRWLVSNPFPAEIDAGMWENFNRFNIENLPQKDWLRPFGRPQPGKLTASGFSDMSLQVKVSPVPEASTAALFALGGVVLAGVATRQRRRASACN